MTFDQLILVSRRIAAERHGDASATVVDGQLALAAAQLDLTPAELADLPAHRLEQLYAVFSSVAAVLDAMPRRVRLRLVGGS